MILELTNELFEEKVLKSDIPVLIQFWATWCSPCKITYKTVEEIAEEYEGKLSVVKVNVDDEYLLTSRHSIRGIPTFVVYKEGGSIASKTGTCSKSQLVAFLHDNGAI